MQPRSSTLATLAALLSGGCGGGVALMHPAHTLPVNTVTMGAGVSGNFVVGSAREDIDAAKAAVPQPGLAVSSEPEDAFFKGGFAQTLLSPGLAPWVGARAGLGYTTDAGLTYTGRGVRLDARHAFETERVALSLGLGTSGRLVRPGTYSASESEECALDPLSPACDPTVLEGRVERSVEVPGLAEGDVTGVGVDVPALVGWRSRAGLVQIWAGVRGGFEKLWGDYAWQIPVEQIQVGELDADRWFVGPLVGLAVGIDPLWAGVEFDMAYQYGDASVVWERQGTSSRVAEQVQGVSLTPTAALGGRF